MEKILVTGGCGYIGSHTIVDLITHGYEVISIDDNSRSDNNILLGIEKITGKKIQNYAVNICNIEDTRKVFLENSDIKGIVHFAAFKSVGESVGNPLIYYQNNIQSLVNILKCAEEFNVSHFVFSSSCTVYGNPDVIPVTELTPQKTAESPYGATKQMGETIVTDVVNSSSLKAILLRYFNPVGAHPSVELGEVPIGKPANLVPVITQSAIGILSEMKVHGNDYDTRDGSCLRDFIHVCDIAHAHTLALQYLFSSKNKANCEIFNLGTGNGYTVLELIKAFEKISGLSLNYSIGPRREGDVIAIYANNNKAKELLQWNPVYNLEAMMDTAWKWELKLKEKNK
jgi:UDP-glucose 4-epimerase